MKKILYFSLFTIFCIGFLNAQCPLKGWASENGGVTGGGTNTPTVVTTYSELKSALSNNAIKVIHISGQIIFPASGRITINSQSGKSILGLAGARLISTDMTSSGSGIFVLKNSSNFIIKNITFEGPGAYDVDGNDNLTIDNSTNIWIDHCTFEDALDGNLDIKNASNYITITWTKFQYLKPPIPGGSGGSNDHRFSNLFGSGDGDTQDTGKLKITMQYCWWGEGVRERMPRVRYGQVHLVNNYFNSTVNNYCIYAGYKADLLIEGNYFEGVKNPIRLESGTFTGVTAINNTFSGTTGTSVGSGTSFTPPYTLDIAPQNTVKTLVMNGAGAILANPTDCTLLASQEVSMENFKFSMYPNPTSEFISLNVTTKESKPFKIMVTDISGQLEGIIYEGILKKGQNSIKNIPLKNIQKGVKFFLIYIDGDVYAQKIIINN